MFGGILDFRGNIHPIGLCYSNPFPEKPGRLHVSSEACSNVRPQQVQTAEQASLSHEFYDLEVTTAKKMLHRQAPTGKLQDSYRPLEF